MRHAHARPWAAGMPRMRAMPSPESMGDDAIAKALTSRGPYPIEAYQFIREGLEYSVGRVQAGIRDAGGTGATDGNHVTGQQLCMGLLDFAITRYGMLAPAVLERWRIHRTDDFGRMVFAMIEVGIMAKTPSDSIEDFRSVYD
ncbi:MAG: hypothetical protein FGM37_07985, partial [Phycisphaerales bacterium]|nr:hypothetical protein [Phycisphaerales bacterium]